MPTNSNGASTHASTQRVPLWPHAQRLQRAAWPRHVRSGLSPSIASPVHRPLSALYSRRRLTAATTTAAQMRQTDSHPCHHFRRWCACMAAGQGRQTRRQPAGFSITTPHARQVEYGARHDTGTPPPARVTTPADHTKHAHHTRYGRNGGRERGPGARRRQHQPGGGFHTKHAHNPTPKRGKQCHRQLACGARPSAVTLREHHKRDAGTAPAQLLAHNAMDARR